MSDEEGVMTLEATLEVAPARVAPEPGKGALGTWWPHQAAWSGRSAGEPSSSLLERAREQTSTVRGCMRASAYTALVLGRLTRESQGQNRTRETRPSGIAGGHQET